MKTYRIVVGPFRFCEFSVHRAMTPQDECKLLGEYLVEAVAAGHRVYGPTHEVRVCSYNSSEPGIP